MNHIEKISRSLEEHNLDAMLITSEPGERYALGRAVYRSRAKTSEGGSALPDLGPEGTSVPGSGLYPYPEI